MSIKVSVITPTYNRASLITSALNMLKSQTLKEIEFIIVDDGSSDNTHSLLLQETKEDKRFIIIKQSNQGPSVARNNALKQANGQYIGFFDIDDVIPDNYYEELYKNAITNDVDIVFTSYNNIKHHLQTAPTRLHRLQTLRNGAIWDKLYKKSLITQNNITFAEGLYTADNLWCIQTFSHAKSLNLTNTPVYKYTLQSDSIGKDKNKQLKRKSDIFTIIDKIQTFAKQNDFSNVEQAQLTQFLKRTYNCYKKDKHYTSQLYEVLNLPKEKHTPLEGITMKLILLKFARLFHILNKHKYNEQRQIELVKQSPLFDRKWYLSQNPDVKAKRIGAAKHYVKHGWKEGRNPSTQFDGNAYLRDNPDIQSANICPLAHYIISGSKEGRWYQGFNTTSVIQNKKTTKSNITDKIKHTLTYPIRVREEYEQLKAELEALKK